MRKNAHASLQGHRLKLFLHSKDVSSIATLFSVTRTWAANYLIGWEHRVCYHLFRSILDILGFGAPMHEHHTQHNLSVLVMTRHCMESSNQSEATLSQTFQVRKPYRHQKWFWGSDNSTTLDHFNTCLKSALTGWRLRPSSLSDTSTTWSHLPGTQRMYVWYVMKYVVLKVDAMLQMRNLDRPSCSAENLGYDGFVFDWIERARRKDNLSVCKR